MKRQKEIQAVKEAEEKIAQLSISYVEYLDNDTLFEKMFEKDEGNIFKEKNIYIYICLNLFSFFNV